MNFLLNLTALLTILMVVVVIVSYKKSPKFKKSDIIYSFVMPRRSMKLSIFAYIVITLITSYEIYDAISNNGGTVLMVFEVLFLSLVYIIFMSVIPRKYYLIDQGLYYHGITNVFGRLFSWSSIDGNSKSDKGEIIFRVVQSGIKKDIVLSHESISVEDIIDKVDCLSKGLGDDID